MPKAPKKTESKSGPDLFARPVASGTPWTDEQRAAITTWGVNLLVSAAAGSGKTAVLAARCAHLVADAGPPCNVDELLVVTYTEAAATEMKSRIEKALRDRLDQTPDDPRLGREIAQIDRLQVGTLHSFCSRLLRQNFHELGLDPNFSILDADEASLLRSEVVHDLFSDRFETDDTGVFQKLIDVYGDGNDASLQARVLRIHDLLNSIVDPNAWLAEARLRITETADKPLEDTTLGQELAATIRRHLASLSRRCAEAIATLRKNPGVKAYVDFMQRVAAEIDSWTAAFADGNFDALAAAARATELPRLPTVKGDVPGKDQARSLVDSVRDAMGKKSAILPLIRFSAAEWAEGLRSTIPHADTLVQLVSEFQGRYTIAKERIRSLDFADLERLALKLLRTPEGQPSAIALACHQRIAHVLVDEYQDINGVQDAILHYVTHESSAERSTGTPPVDRKSQAGRLCYEANLFFVGDVKQSIYSFRLAEPTRFLERYARYRAGGDGKVIDLQANFRSRAPLLDAINALFERLMTQDAADIAYDEHQRLKPAAKFPAPNPDGSSFTGSPVELHLLPKDIAPAGEDDELADQDRAQREAAFIASRIHELLGHGDGQPKHVVEKLPDGSTASRPIEFRDIVILLRTTKVKADDYAKVLEAHSIPVHRDSGSGYFNTTEVRDVLSLLRLLDNAQQDVPLAAVLRSPLAALAEPEDCFARIRLAYPITETTIPFHEAVRRYAAEHDDDLSARLRDFFDQFDRWRAMSRLRPLAELLQSIFAETGYLAFCGGLENGDQRCANLHDLLRRAQQFGNFSRQGLYRFLRFLEGLEEQTDLGQPSVLGEGENVVRIMSVHKAKGLEFPVVFVPDLAKGFNLADTRGRIVVDRARYLGLEAFDETKQVRYPSLAGTLVSERLRQQTLAEELRVLYVALTRAKEHLILLGSTEPECVEEWRASWAAHAGPLPAEQVLAAHCPLDWIGAAAAAIAGAGDRLFDVHTYSSDELRDRTVAAERRTGLSAEQIALANLTPLDPAPPENSIAKAVIDRLSFRYRHESFAKLRAYMPVTEWSAMEKASSASGSGARLLSSDLRLPASLSENVAIAATDKGTATHLVLEHLDFLRPCRGSDLSSQIEEMLHKQLILKAHADAVDLAAIEWFVGSELGQIIRSTPAEDVLREMPFNLALAPQRIPNGQASADPLDQVMLRGRIDLALRSKDAFTVIDYKTDNVTVAELGLRQDFYRPQVALYREALQALTPLPVAAVYLVFLTPREILRM